MNLLLLIIICLVNCSLASSAKLLPLNELKASNASNIKFNLPKIIWMYFNSGQENSGILSKKFYHHNSKMLENTGWQLIFLSDLNLKQYLNVSEVEDFMQKVRDGTLAMKADLIRLILLREHGGVWMDTSSYLLEDLSWLEDLDNNPYLQVKFNSSPKVFLFTNSLLDHERLKYPRKWISKGHTLLPNIQNWFLAAVAKSQFITDWIETFKQISSMNPSTMSIELASKGYQLSFYDEHPYYRCYTSKTIALTRMQNALNSYQAINLSTTMLYAMEHYGIWTMQSSIGPLLHEATSLFLETFKLHNLMKFTVEEVYAYRKAKYFIKVPSFVKEVIELSSSVVPSQKMTDTNDRMIPTRKVFNLTGRYKCLNEFYILENSLAFNLLRSEGENPTDEGYRFYSYESIPLICHHFNIWEVLTFGVLIILSFIGFICAFYNRKASSNEMIKIENQQLEMIHPHQNMQNLIVEPQMLLNLSFYFADMSIAAIAWSVNTFSLFLSMSMLKLISFFTIMQFISSLIFTVIFYKTLANIFAKKHSISMRELWKGRVTILLALICQHVIFEEIKQYYYQPNSSLIPEMMIGCVTMKQYFSKIVIWLVMYFLLMEELLVERNILKWMKALFW